jgi:hypothetical protein
LEVAPIDFVEWTEDDFTMHRIEANLLNSLNAYVYSRDRACIFWEDRCALLVQRTHPRLIREHGSVCGYGCDLPNGHILRAELGDKLAVKEVFIGGPRDEFWNDLLKNFKANIREVGHLQEQLRQFAH